LDIYTAAEYLIHKKGIDPEDIVFAGFSMGGANTTKGASLIQEKYPEKKIKAININSFSSLHLEIQTVLKNKGILAAIGRLGATLLALDMDVKKDWDSLNGEKVIFYNPKDPLIPHPAQLATAVQKKPIGKSHLIQLPSTSDHIPFNEEVEINTFYAALRDLLDIKPSLWNSSRKISPTLEKRTIEQVA
jgi:dienelactone hydrolase